MQTPVHIFPVAETGRKITSRDACPVAVKHRLHEQAVIRSRASDMAFTTQKKVFDPAPLIVA